MAIPISRLERGLSGEGYDIDMVRLLSTRRGIAVISVVSVLAVACAAEDPAVPLEVAGVVTEIGDVAEPSGSASPPGAGGESPSSGTGPTPSSGSAGDEVDDPTDGASTAPDTTPSAPASPGPTTTAAPNTSTTAAPTPTTTTSPAPTTAAPAPTTAAPAPTTTAAPAPSNTLADRWATYLAGRQAYRQETYSSSTPGGGGYAAEWRINFCTNGAYSYIYNVNDTQVGSSSEQDQGTWVVSGGDSPILTATSSVGAGSTAIRLTGEPSSTLSDGGATWYLAAGSC